MAVDALGDLAPPPHATLPQLEKVKLTTRLARCVDHKLECVGSFEVVARLGTGAGSSSKNTGHNIGDD